jgi:hypothetical protein
LQRNPPPASGAGFDGRGRDDDGSPASVQCSLRIAQAFVKQPVKRQDPPAVDA